MSFKGLEDINVTGIESILSFPNTGDYYFWAKILLSIWLILGIGFFFEERKRLGNGNILSAIAFSSVPIIVLAIIGSTFEIITSDILISIIVLGSVFIFIWYVKRDN